MVVEEEIILRICRLLDRADWSRFLEVYLHDEQHTLTLKCRCLQGGGSRRKAILRFWYGA